MILDAHTHIWPDKIAHAALTANPVPGLTARGDGTQAGLSADMAESGIGLSCCLAIANRPHQIERVNEFVASVRAPDRFPVGTVHVERTVEENLTSLRTHGLTAVKVHPLFQDFALDDPRLWEIFEAFGSDIAVITHVGEGGDAHRNSLSSPAMVRDIKRQFPDLRLIACHFGGYHQFEEAQRTLDGADVILETSWPPSLATLRPDEVRALVRRHGADRVVFGSDWPMTSPREEIAAIESLRLGDDETKSVLGGTLARVLGIDSSWAR